MQHSRTNEKCRVAGAPRAWGGQEMCELGEMGWPESHRSLRAMVRRPVILRVEGSHGGFLSRGEAVKV